MLPMEIALKTFPKSLNERNGIALRAMLARTYGAIKIFSALVKNKVLRSVCPPLKTKEEQTAGK